MRYASGFLCFRICFIGCSFLELAGKLKEAVTGGAKLLSWKDLAEVLELPLSTIDQLDQRVFSGNLLLDDAIPEVLYIWKNTSGQAATFLTFLDQLDIWEFGEYAG